MELEKFWSAPDEMLRELVLNNCLFIRSVRDQVQLQGSGANRGYWCKHTAALCYKLIEVCETKTLMFLLGLSLDIPRMLEEDQPHREPLRSNVSSISQRDLYKWQEESRAPRAWMTKAPQPHPPAIVVVDSEVEEEAGCSINAPIQRLE